MQDETERYRRARSAELNQDPRSREELAQAYGEILDPGQLRERFEVMAFLAPLVIVKSRVDGSLGSFEFQHLPRFYFNYSRD